MQDLVTVFGGSGFIGNQVVRALVRKGLRVRIAVRQPNLAYKARLAGDVGQVDLFQANVRNYDSVARAMEGAQGAVNLTGVLFERGRQKFASIHVEGAGNIAKAARAAGATALVHVSALGADPNSASAYARTKAEGEAAVRAAFPEATIIRPSTVFGPEDNFFNKFARMAMLSPALPLIGGGATRFQPVYVGDVAQAIARAVTDAGCQGKTYELGGPSVYSFRELMELILAETGRKRALLPIPFAMAGPLGMIGDLLSAVIAPPVTSDQLKLLKTDNVVSPGAPGLAELGVEPTAVEGVVPTYLYRYRRGGQYAEQTDRLPPTEPSNSTMGG
jgi:NADH dehydrogenase